MWATIFRSLIFYISIIAIKLCSCSISFQKGDFLYNNLYCFEQIIDACLFSLAELGQQS